MMHGEHPTRANLVALDAVTDANIMVAVRAVHVGPATNLVAGAVCNRSVANAAASGASMNMKPIRASDHVVAKLLARASHTTGLEQRSISVLHVLAVHAATRLPTAFAATPATAQRPRCPRVGMLLIMAHF